MSGSWYTFIVNILYFMISYLDLTFQEEDAGLRRLGQIVKVIIFDL